MHCVESPFVLLLVLVLFAALLPMLLFLRSAARLRRVAASMRMLALPCSTAVAMCC